LAPKVQGLMSPEEGKCLTQRLIWLLQWVIGSLIG